MAKQKRSNTTVSAINSLLCAINAVAASEKAKIDGSLTHDQQISAINQAMDVVGLATEIIGDSNIITASEFQDDAIADYHNQVTELEAREAQAALEEAQAVLEEAQARVNVLMLPMIQE